MATRRSVAGAVALVIATWSCAAALAQTSGPAASVVTEARRREIIKTAEAMTSETFADVLRRAEAGDVEAQVLAGIVFQDGKVVPRDLDRAVHWTRLAAENNHPVAQNTLGWFYDTGTGLPQDSQKAVEWFTKAAAQGYAQAQANLGLAYFDGRGVAANPAEGVRLFRLAAEQGNVKGQGLLGNAHAGGRGVERDPREAVAWYRKAAEQGDAAGQEALGSMYMLGIGVGRDNAQAAVWIRKAAEQGATQAQVKLAMLYLEGKGVPRDRGQAEKWLYLASELGDPIGSFFHGELMLDSPIPMADKAADRLTLSAEQGYPVAAFSLGLLLSSGAPRVARDDLGACKWFVIASRLDERTDVRWEDLLPGALAKMREDLPGKINKARKSAGPERFADCERQASDWMRAHPQRPRE